MSATARAQQRTALIEVPSLVNAVQQAVRTQILDGTIRPGATVTEVAIATEFCVARTTAKAAVERLVHDGLLCRQANKSARVPIIEIKDVLDAYLGRRLLEGAVIQRLAEEARVPEETHIALKRFGTAIERNEWVQAAETEISFHQSLVDSLGSKRLSRIFGSLMDETQLCRAEVWDQSAGLPSQLAPEYAAIVDAIQAGDPTQAVLLIDTNLANTSSRIITHLQSHRPG